MSNSQPAMEKGGTTVPKIETQSSSGQAQPSSPAETIHAEPLAGSGPSNVEPTTPTPDSTSTRTVQQALQQSINRNNFEEEVGQVMGSLSSWWGGVKKQSASALTTLKADLDKTVHQAQADLDYLRTANIEVVRKDPSEYAAEQEAEKAKKAKLKAEKEEEVRSKEKGKGKEKAPGEGGEEESKNEEGITASNLFDKITSSTSQLQNTLQNTLQSTLQSNPTLTNPELLRSKLAENLKISSAKENLQLSMKQAEKLAEEYLKKSEGLLKDAEKWVEENVKVLPPDQQGSMGNDGNDDDRHMVSMGWDGSDFYSFSTSTPTTQSQKSTNKDVLFDSSSTPEKSKPISSLALAGSRKDALLRRLREDKDLLMVDPEGEGETDERKEEFKQWINEHFEIEKKESREQEEGNVGGIRMALVPEHLTDDQFWQRYLFHKHMIEGEEKKRKALLQATTQESETDDFNWDDEPEESSPTLAPSPSTTTTTAPSTTTADATPKMENDGKLPTSSSIPKSITSTSTSPRDSEESYDVVSDQGNVKKPNVAQPTAPVNEDDEDSDWE